MTMRESTLRLRSVTPKAGGAKVLVLRSDIDTDKLRRDLKSEADRLCDRWGKGLRGFFLGTYDADGAFHVSYHVDGRVVRFHEAHAVFSAAIARQMCPGS